VRFTRLAIAMMLVVPVAAHAQSSDSLSLQGRSNVTIGLGLTGSHNATASASGVASNTSSWELGSIAFHHWIRPQVAMLVEIDAMSEDNLATPTGSHSNEITPLLVGFRYSPRAVAITRSLRPYASAAAGAYFHSMSETSIVGTASASTETAPGARLAVGSDWFAARYFVVSVEGAYHAIGSFGHPDVATEMAHGFGASLAFGFAWGGN